MQNSMIWIPVLKAFPFEDEQLGRMGGGSCWRKCPGTPYSVQLELPDREYPT